MDAARVPRIRFNLERGEFADTDAAAVTLRAAHWLPEIWIDGEPWTVEVWDPTGRSNAVLKPFRRFRGVFVYPLNQSLQDRITQGGEEGHLPIAE